MVEVSPMAFCHTQLQAAYTVLVAQKDWREAVTWSNTTFHVVDLIIGKSTS